MNVAEGTELTALRMGVSRAFEGLSKSCSGLHKPDTPMADPFVALRDYVIVCDSSGKIVRATSIARSLGCIVQPGRYISELTQKDILSTEAGSFDLVDAIGNRRVFEYTVSKVGSLRHVSFYDVTEHLQQEEQLRTHSKIYAVLTDQAVQLLTRETSDDLLTIRQLLSNIAHASLADGCILLQNNHQTRDIRVKTYVSIGYDYSGNLGLTELFPAAVSDLARRRNYVGHARSMPVAHAIFCYDVQTFVIVPVYVNGYWWGELVFFYTKSYSDSWYYAECDALRTTSAVISGVLSRVAQIKARANAYLFQQALFDVVPLPLYAKTLDGAFYYANAEFCRLVGLKKDEIFLLKDSDVFNTHTTGVSELNVEFVNRAGERCSGVLSETQLKSESGSVHGVLGVYQPKDSCANSCMHRSVDLLNSLLDNSGQYVLYKDSQGVVIYANSAFTKVAGAVQGKTNLALASELPDDFMRLLFDAELKAASTGASDSFSALFAGHLVEFTLKPIRNQKLELLGYLLTGSISEKAHIRLDAIQLPAVTTRNDLIIESNSRAKELGLVPGIGVPEVPGYTQIQNADGSTFFIPAVKTA